MNIYKQRIESLRLEMKKHNIDIYLVLTSDPHLSEYLPDFWKTREWLSGFSGSQGTLIVTLNDAMLWADGRYWIQAQKELEGSDIQLQKQDTNNTYVKWLESNVLPRQTIATDFRVLPLFVLNDLRNRLDSKDSYIIHKDLISELWLDRATLPKAIVYEHEISPTSRAEKLKLVRDSMREYKANYHLIATLDDIAYICNLRGSDVPYNPVFLSFLLISLDSAILFVEISKISNELKKILEKDNIEIQPYNKIENILKTLKGKNILLDSIKMNANIANIISNDNTIIYGDNPSQLQKACKNNAEIAHIREAMVIDGIALCNFFAWLEDALHAKQTISELDIDSKLTYYRSQSPFYISDSFATIAGFNANGAQPHYRATSNGFSYIQGNGLLLIDSGAQYTKGTTDITRVVPIGDINKEQKRDYTLVLKANIALSSSIFPLDIPMPLLDSITRASLWKEQIDYMHGTGHGVGYFLNVHEGPQVISYFAQPLHKTKAKIGMVSSIEPGIYRANKWGIRLENLVVNQKVKNAKEKDFGEFLYFETLTLCPFEISCIDSELLNDDEKKWINNYHKKVFNELKDKLNGKAKEWLEKKTIPIA